MPDHLLLLPALLPGHLHAEWLEGCTHWGLVLMAPDSPWFFFGSLDFGHGPWSIQHAPRAQGKQQSVGQESDSLIKIVVQNHPVLLLVKMEFVLLSKCLASPRSLATGFGTKCQERNSLYHLPICSPAP